MTEKLINQKWWKLLGILLLLYTVIAGLGVPLKPGVTRVEKIKATAPSEYSTTVTFYNYDFKNEDDNLLAWLKVADEHILKAKKIEKGDSRNLILHFDLPDRSPVDQKIDLASLIVQLNDETVVYPDAVFISYEDNADSLIKTHWAKYDGYVFPVSQRFRFPFRNILEESIRNTYFHVALWFAMFILLLTSVVYSIKFLRTKSLKYDSASRSLTFGGLLFGLMGFATGMVWAKYTWGSYWPQDVKLNMTAIALLIYLSYFVLRQSIKDEDRARTISSVYNIFAFSSLIPLIFIIPRLTDSLHPGNGGNPALGVEDMDNTMRMVFYPAILGWTLLGFWISSLKHRIHLLQEKLRA